MNREIRIDLGKFFYSVKMKWWIIVICGAVFFSVAALITMNPGEDGYSADTTVYSMSYSSMEEATTGSSAINAYSNIITSRKVAESARAIIGDKYDITAKQIQGMITATTAGNLTNAQAVVIKITAYSENENLSVDVANAVANAFVNEIRSMTGSTTVQILDSAQNASMYKSASMNQVKFRIIGLLIGIFIPVILIFFKELFSNKVYRVEDITLDGVIELIGVIPDYDNN